MDNIINISELSSFVRKTRSEKKMTLAELSEKTKMSPSYLHRLENSNRRWNLKSADAVLKGLGVSACLLVGASIDVPVEVHAI